MAIKRYTATADNTITDAFYQAGQLAGAQIRATIANMGGADTLEVFTINSRAYEDSVEKSRILVNFDFNKIIEDRQNYTLPASGSVKFYLRMYNVEHSETVPKDFTLSIFPISRSWDEGIGLDLDNYTDNGRFFTTAVDGGAFLGTGSNWISASNDAEWTTEGGDFLYDWEMMQYFETGIEDLEVEVTDVVEKKLLSSSFMYGFAIQISPDLEGVDGTYGETKYTKRFSARSSEYFFKRPVIEARWEPQIKDDYPTYKISNPTTQLTHESNYVNVYYYNQFNGMKIPITSSVTTSSIEVGIFTGSQLVGGGVNAVTSPSTYSKTKINDSTYKFSFVLDSTDADLAPLVNGTTSVITASYKVFNTSPAFTLYSETGSLNIIKEQVEQYASPQTEYTFKVVNLKPTYKYGEKAVFQVFSRPTNWNPNIYTKATQTIETTRHKNLYYKIVRVADNYTVIDYGTGSFKYTQLDYDRGYNFFELDMSILEPDYSYEIILGLDYTYTFKEIKDKFKFRVVE